MKDRGMLDVRRRKGFWCTRHRRYGWDLEVGRLGPGRSRAMAGPHPLEKCIALEPRGARRSGGPSTICPCLGHTTEYFLDPDIDCSLLTMAWRGYPHGGLRRRRANDTDPPPFCRGLEGDAATRELALDGERRHAARSPCSAPANGAGPCSEAAPGLDLVQSLRAARAYAAQEPPERNASARATEERRQPVGTWFWPPTPS